MVGWLPGELPGTGLSVADDGAERGAARQSDCVHLSDCDIRGVQYRQYFHRAVHRKRQRKTSIKPRRLHVRRDCRRRADFHVRLLFRRGGRNRAV